jgi:hypothetical protein
MVFEDVRGNVYGNVVVVVALGHLHFRHVDS